MDKLNANITECAAAMAAQHKATKRLFAKMVVFAAVAMVMMVALTATVGTTLAYFTTYASAKGSIPIVLEEKTEITDEMDGNEKVVTITNSGENSRPVFVRVKAFSGSTYPLEYTGSSWILGEDGYYYYSNANGSLKILEPGAATAGDDALRVSIEFPKNAVNGDKFNVVVVYETTPVLYNPDGTTYADWSVILDNGNISAEENTPKGGDQ